MSKKDDRIKLTPTAAKDHLLQYFSNCEMQIKTNQRPTSLCIEGAAGIAKTSLVKQMKKFLLCVKQMTFLKTQ